MTTITIRGHDFATKQDNDYIPLDELVKLYFVFRAIEGDALAIEILNAAKKIVKDKNGMQLWPPKTE